MTLRACIAEYAATPARRRTLAVVAANLIAFAGLIAYMFRVRSHSQDWPMSSPFEFGSLLMVFAMAMSGICGSITISVGANSANQGKFDEAVRWVAIAISAWVTFLFLETVEWVRMVYLVELGPSTPFGYTYLLITGTHWVAVILCTVWFTFVVSDVRKRDVLAAALYSHFLALWWIVIVIFLYFPNLNPLEDL